MEGNRDKEKRTVEHYAVQFLDKFRASLKKIGDKHGANVAISVLLSVHYNIADITRDTETLLNEMGLRPEDIEFYVREDQKW